METFFYIILGLHLFIAALAFNLMRPPDDSKTTFEKKQRKLFDTNFPILYYIALLLLMPSTLYWIYYSCVVRREITIIFSHISLITIVYTVIISFVYLVILVLLEKKEYKSRGETIKKEYPDLITGILIFFYSTSVFLGLTTVFILDYTLDSSKGEERIVTVIDSVHNKKQNFGGDIEDYYHIHFEPDVLDVKRINVSPRLQSLAKKGDKLRLYLKSGACGLPYISSEMELIK
ncbi:MAG: hypothetical protein II961_08770 [Candidatus Riflebacteria bacterium]|nr:hypothetical protein [Candidatus Riflebacteria bacterium]